MAQTSSYATAFDANIAVVHAADNDIRTLPHYLFHSHHPFFSMDIIFSSTAVSQV